MLREINTFSFRKMDLKISPGKWRPFWLGLNMLNDYIPYLSGVIMAVWHSCSSTKINIVICVFIIDYIPSLILMSSLNNTLVSEKLCLLKMPKIYDKSGPDVLNWSFCPWMDNVNWTCYPVKRKTYKFSAWEQYQTDWMYGIRKYRIE